MIELLLVVAIIAVIAAVSTPSFVRSIRGNRLRVATRTVVMAGRYARSMAVVRQEELPLRFDLDGGKVSVGDEVHRSLDLVKIEYVLDESTDDRKTEGSCTIVYKSNGRCTPYEVRLVSQDDEVATITVDALSSARVEQGS